MTSFHQKATSFVQRVPEPVVCHVTSSDGANIVLLSGGNLPLERLSPHFVMRIPAHEFLPLDVDFMVETTVAVWRSASRSSHCCKSSIESVKKTVLASRKELQMIDEGCKKGIVTAADRLSDFTYDVLMWLVYRKVYDGIPMFCLVRDDANSRTQSILFIPSDVGQN
jgi:hypothetical protein